MRTKILQSRNVQKCPNEDLLGVTRSAVAFTNIVNYKKKLFKVALKLRSQQARNSDTVSCLAVKKSFTIKNLASHK